MSDDKKTAKNAQHAEEDAGAEEKTGLEQKIIRDCVTWWSNYRFLNIKFSVVHGKGQCPGELVDSTKTLGERVEQSFLTIPEIRELILKLEAVVESPESNLKWAFATWMCNTGRETIIYITKKKIQDDTPEAIQDKADDDDWIGFKVEGKPARKGAKKRDGPLWSLEGISFSPLTFRPH